MALLICHECGAKVSSEARSCPSCGASVKTSKNSAAKTMRIVWYVVCAFILLFVFRSCYQVGGALTRIPDYPDHRSK